MQRLKLRVSRASLQKAFDVIEESITDANSVINLRSHSMPRDVSSAMSNFRP